MCMARIVQPVRYIKIQTTQLGMKEGKFKKTKGKNYLSVKIKQHLVEQP